MSLDRRLLLGSLAALGGCAAQPGRLPGLAPGDAPPPLAPLRVHPDRLFDITVCLRPFRAAGPRLDAETIGDALVVHNYGHGGSGWSLSWGSAAQVMKKALAGSPREVAVIGCGALGLTAAITAQRAGVAVTMYCKDLVQQTRSARATGSWTPDSRIALTDKAAPGFPALWEEMARTSWKTYRDYLGLPGNPVIFSDRYNLSDIPFGTRPPEPAGALEFAEYMPRIADITARAINLPPGANPFPTKFARRTENLQFNIRDYAHTLLNDFRLTGGKIVIREFHDPAEFGQLPQKVVINCTGYGARALMRDDSIVPVRGQIGWLIPQPEVNYGLFYNGVSVLSRTDGIVFQSLEGGDMRGYNNDHEVVDRAEADSAVGVIGELMSRMR
jgi:D-amino-acid oxidase